LSGEGDEVVFLFDAIGSRTVSRATPRFTLARNRAREKERERARDEGNEKEERQREGTEKDRNGHQRKIKKRSKDLKAEPVIARRPLVRAEKSRAANVGVAR